MMTKTPSRKQVKHLKMYWLMFSSCSYPGPPGPGPGIDDNGSFSSNRSQHLDDDNTSQKMCCNNTNNNNKSKNNMSNKSYQHLKRINTDTKYNKHSNRRRSLLDSNLLWIFLGFIWLSSPTLVGCRNDDEPLLVSNCDFNRLERSLNRIKGASKITTTTNNNNCTYVKLNYYDYVNDSSSTNRNNDKNNNNKNYSDLHKLSSSSSSYSSFSPNSAELFPATIDTINNNDNNNINTKEKKQSQIEIDQNMINEYRLEAIKAQILSKLGLKSKPHVTHTVPREIVLETINRAAFNYDNNQSNDHQKANKFKLLSADNSADIDYKVTNDFYERQEFYKQHPGYSQTMHSQEQHEFPPPRQDPDEQENEQDFHAKTSEIIAFAGKGKVLNGQRLLEFSITTDDRSLMHQELRVRTAMLWVKVDLRPGISLQHKKKFRRIHQHDKKSLTLWVFRLVEPFDNYGGGYLNDKDFDRATDLIALQQIKMSQLGWQKINLTTAMSKWYSEGGNRKLRLLIDCSGCGDRIVVHLFNAEQNNYNNNRKNLSNNVKSNHQNLINNKKSHQRDLHNHYNNVKSINNNNNNNYHLNAGQMSNKKRNTIPKDHLHTFAQPNNNSSSNNQSEQNHPFLVVQIVPNIIKRVRRRAVECTGALEGQCCKQRFYVSFKEIGWDDWILAPPGYYANYCRGDCGGIFRTPDTYTSYHAHFIEEYRKAEKLEGMQPCCAPTKFSSMSLIYYGPDEKIIKRDLPKMVVEECGCP